MWSTWATPRVYLTWCLGVSGPTLARVVVNRNRALPSSRRLLQACDGRSADGLRAISGRADRVQACILQEPCLASGGAAMRYWRTSHILIFTRQLRAFDHDDP